MVNRKRIGMIVGGALVLALATSAPVLRAQEGAAPAANGGGSGGTAVRAGYLTCHVAAGSLTETRQMRT